MSKGLTPTPARAGTGFGTAIESLVTSTHFERATTAPAEVHAIVYDDVETLIAQGILPAVERQVPEPFPADTKAYCKPPQRRARG